MTAEKSLNLITHDKRHPPLPQNRDQLRLDLTLNSVVRSLVDGGLDPSLLITERQDFLDLRGFVVGDTESLELAFLEERVRRLEGLGPRRLAVRAMEVPKRNEIDAKGFEGCLDGGSTEEIEKREER
jgi:hypothetical protein